MSHRQISSWNKVARWWDAEAGETGIWHQVHDIDPVIWRILGNVKNKRVLEIGCGNGYLARQLSQAGAAVTAVDYSSTFITMAKAKERTQRLGIRYLHQDAAKLHGLPTRSFDIIVSDMALMDVRNFRSAIRRAARTLRPGGRFIFSIVHPIYSDWQHQVVRYQGREYFARVMKGYLSETSDYAIRWGNGLRTVHYHRPLQSYLHALSAARLVVKDLFELRSSKPLVRATSRDANVKNKFTRHYLNARDKKLKLAMQREFPLFLVVEAVIFPK